MQQMKGGKIFFLTKMIMQSENMQVPLTYLVLRVLHELHKALHLQTNEPDNPLLPTKRKIKNLLLKY